RSRAAHRIRARRWDSLNVNGICVALLQQLGQKKRPPVRLASLRWRPGGLSDPVALVPWLCVTVFRRLCSEQHQLFLRGLAAALPTPPRLLMLRSAYYAALHAVALPVLARRLRDAGVILCYHNVTPAEDAAVLGDAGVHLSLDKFTTQVQWLARHYDVVPLR